MAAAAEAYRTMLLENPEALDQILREEPVKYRYSTGPGGTLRGRRNDAIGRLTMADSYSRMGAVLALSRRREFWSVLGNEWTICDNIARHAPRLQQLLARRWLFGFPINEAMTQAEVRFLEKLPATVTVFRGCYAQNADGISWTLERDVAEKFPTLNRYRQQRSQPLLVEGEVEKSNIAFVKLDRNEYEVVTLPGLVRQRCHWLLEESDPA
jgi:hypothetical protein